MCKTARKFSHRERLKSSHEKRPERSMRILAAASALPKHYYPQNELIDAFRKHWGKRLERFGILERLHAATQVDGRFLALPLSEYPLKSWGHANDRWIEASLELGERAVCRAVTRAGIDAKDIGAIFFVSITGIASPSIEARLINRMGLSNRMKRMPIFGLGCVAGAAGIARAADYVRAFPKEACLVLSVELCSLTVQQDDLSAANLISTGLFGDGAAAAIVAGRDCAGGDGPTIVATRSTLYTDTERVMGWDISEKGFQIVLSREVPDVIRQNLGKDVDEFLAEQGLGRTDIRSWVIHTGGPKVLEATQDALGLQNGELQVSWDCLRRTGNLSSASVLLVLEEVLENHRPATGTWGLLAAMGPGFCSELVLFQG
ncbi:MAG TPA: 3-oxoacyl-[acyl-carrier-protein] synthase III C-terminal domain-containing protein [Bryobacteraceae bacterium]|nr:3-oxoacyl-[acyl-carrier-protein] synthase III C-terminal domain-containing protein [Bryobacteraceae bacterium]